MLKLRVLPYLASALLFASCGGGGNNSTPSTATTTTSVQQVSGTLVIGNPGSTALSFERSPQFVSASTKHAALFINGVAAAAGTSTTCVASTGTAPNACTISWTANLAVPASYVFAVETDTGTNAPANTVISEGAGSYAIVAGTNTLTPALSLNGIVTGAAFAVTACSGTTPNSLCNGTVSLSAPAGNLISYTGAVAVPTTGNSPSSGNVFDNGNVTLVSSAPAIGTITGTAQATFSSLAAGTLTVSGVDTTGVYTFQVTCAGGATGTFGITLGGASTPSGIITAAELSGLTTPVSLPANGVTVVGTAPSFTCTGGNISSSTGTLPVN